MYGKKKKKKKGSSKSKKPKKAKRYQTVSINTQLNLNKRVGGYVMKKRKKLTSKQKKIARLGGNKNKIDAADFRKLRRRRKRK